MFNRAEKEPSQYDVAITQLLNQMTTYGPDTPEYSAALAQLKTLTDIQQAVKPERKRVSPDTVAIVAGNLLGIGIIVIVEQKNVWASAAQKMLLKAH